MRNDPTPHERAALDAFFAGGCTPEERAEIAELLARFPEEEGRLTAWREGARRYDAGLGNAPDAVTLYEAWRRWVTGDGRTALAAGLAASTVDDSAHSLTRSRGRRGADDRPIGSSRLRAWRSWAYGAMAVGAAGIIAIAITRAPTSGSGTFAARTYSTKAGERMALTLSDGSRVILAPRTMLRIDGDFGRTLRGVSLHGQAYFDVRRTGRPFVVRVGRAQVDVLGTAFDVRQYDDDAVTRVAVVTGKVAVVAATAGGPAGSRLVLTAGTLGQVTDSTVTATSADVDTYVGWTDGRMTFHNVPVSDVLATLGRWYDLRFTLADSTLARRHIVGTFDYGSSAELLSALKALLDVSMTFDGRNVTLHPRRETYAAPTRVGARDSLTHYQSRENGR